MTLDLKTLAVFLPFVAAASYGMTFTANGKLLHTVSLSTYLLLYCLAGVALALALHFFSPDKINFSVLAGDHMGAWVALSVGSSILGWTLVLYAIPLTSAVYASAGEISYPLFTALFSYLLFQSRVSWATAIGGLLIMIGSLILVTGKLKGGG